MRFLFNDGGIGDAVLMSAVAENGGPCLVSSLYNELLEKNPLITTQSVAAADALKDPEVYMALVRRGYTPHYVHYWELEEKETGAVYWRYPSTHMIAAMCTRAGVFGELRAAPKIYLDDEEIAKGRRVKRPYLVMQSTGAQWKTAGYDTWAEVARKLGRDYRIFQVGAATDRPLPEARNLCGLLSLRQVAAVIYNATAFLGLVGGLMHIARAVDTRAVISFGDSEPLYFSGYIANEHAESGIRCDLCRSNQLNMFSGDSCPREYVCCRSIGAESIVAAFERLHGRLHEPLETEIVNNEGEKEKETPNARLLYYKTQLRPARNFQKIQA